MPNLKERIDKLKSKKTKPTVKDTVIVSSEREDGFFDFLIGSALIGLAFIFGRKK